MSKIFFKTIVAANFISFNLLGGNAWGMCNEGDGDAQRRSLTTHQQPYNQWDHPQNSYPPAPTVQQPTQNQWNQPQAPYPYAPPVHQPVHNQWNQPQNPFPPAPTLKGVVVVDFEDIGEGKTRVVALNTKTQELILYEEFFRPSIKAHLQGYVLELDFLGQVNVQNDQNYCYFREPIIIRSKNNIYVNNVNSPPHTFTILSYNIRSSRVELYNICSSEIRPLVKTPQQIKESLPPSNKREDEAYPLIITENYQDLETLPKKEKGYLGELATALTMLSFGYIQHPSKYGGDNGLDGVFEDVNKNYLFLTQTKQEGLSRTAKNIMKNYLNENKIWETVQKMEEIGTPEVKQVSILMRNYFSEKPQAVYKLAHRVMNKGKAQCQVNQLNILGFPRMGPCLYNASFEDKIQSIRSVMHGFEAHPYNRLRLMFQAELPISEQDASRWAEQLYASIYISGN